MDKEKLRSILLDFLSIGVLVLNGKSGIDQAISAILELEGKETQPYWYKDDKGDWHHIVFEGGKIYLDGEVSAQDKKIAELEKSCSKYKDEIEKQAAEIEQVDFERDRYREALNKISEFDQAKHGWPHNLAKQALEQTGGCPSCGGRLKKEVFDKIIRVSCGMCPYETTKNKINDGTGKNQKG